MVLYRLATSEERARDLSGIGAATVGGRWNGIGTPALYTSQSRALALLEMLVYANQRLLPQNMALITFIVLDTEIITIDHEELPEGWATPGNASAQILGTQYLKNLSVLGLQVPSAVLPAEFNVVLYPRCAAFQASVIIESVDEMKIDARLMR